MEFPLYGNHQPHKHGKKVKEANRTIVPNVDKLALKLLTLYIAVEAKVRTLPNAEIQPEITSDFLLTRSAILRLLYYCRQIEPEKIPMVLQAHVEGSSLRGISPTVNLAYNTVLSLVRAASQKGQIFHKV